MGILSVDNYRPILKSLIHLINKKPDFADLPKAASDDEMLNALIESDMLMAVKDGDGAILTDEKGQIILW